MVDKLGKLEGIKVTDVSVANGWCELLTTEPRIVGYWSDPDDPIDSDDRLPHPQDFIDTDWSSEERNQVISYLEAGMAYQAYFGCSHCRLGCTHLHREMGIADLTDGHWIYPEGYPHYLRCHDVKPPQAFLDHIRLNEYLQPKLKEVHPPTPPDQEYVERHRGNSQPRITDSEIEEFVRKGIEETRSKRPWWHFW